MRRGFTLIELLVVIAIIGILAAMVFPVFARARESARKVVCISNVKNIALALQMYLTDHNGTFPPGEHNQGFVSYWLTHCSDCPQWDAANKANPYLRWPVILDGYTKNREVWLCPSAKIMRGARFIIPVQDFMGYWIANEGSWGAGGVGPCARSWPSGWGGSVTDSIAQGRYAGPHPTNPDDPGDYGAFLQSIATSEQDMHDAKAVAFDDVVATPVCADAGVEIFAFNIHKMAYPDVCRLACSWPDCCGGGDYPPYPPDDGRALTDPSFRKFYARHLGGLNVGFADGHAAWLDSERLISAYADSLRGERSAIDATYIGACMNSIGCCQDDCPAPFLF